MNSAVFVPGMFAFISIGVIVVGALAAGALLSFCESLQHREKH